MRTRDNDKEQLVVTKAIEQIAADGFQGFSMNKLAKACNISVATLYIYYKDKDDLIKKIGVELTNELFATMMKGFRPEMNFADGLWKQWQNRAAYFTANTAEVRCYETIRTSSHALEILQQTNLDYFKNIMGQFIENAINNKELKPMTLEAYWSVAYGSLHALLNFHMQGRSIGGRPFTFSEAVMKETFDAVVKALKP